MSAQSLNNAVAASVAANPSPRYAKIQQPFSVHYQTGRQSGLLPPIAAAVAAYYSAPSVAKSSAAAIRTINPAGAAAIFALGLVAGLSGSLAIAAVVAAFIAGLYVVKVSAAVVGPSVPSSADQPAQAAAVVQPAMPMAPAIAALFPGLTLQRVELKQPAPIKNGKPQA